MKKRIIPIGILLVLLICNVVLAGNNVKVYVNGMRLNHDVILENDRTYVPLRAVSEAMGADVAWDDKTQSAYISFTEDDAISKIVADISPSVVTIVGNYVSDKEIHKYNNPTVHGTGVIYKSNGYIVTNAHVVEDIKNTTVVFNDGTSLPANVLYSDEKADLAVVKVDKLGLMPITFADESSILSGKTAIAIGTPISLSMRNTVTKGIVSGKDVAVGNSYYKLLQTDAAINPGNSGGPLVNSKGELIGINTMKFVSAQIDNVGFAIPVDTVKFVISQFEKYGYVKRPSLKFEMEEAWEAKIGLPTNKGITVKSSTDPEIQKGDIINSINGINVHSIADFNETVKDTYDGSKLNITVTRNTSVINIILK